MIGNKNKKFKGFANTHFRDLEETESSYSLNSSIVHALGRFGVGTLLIPSGEAYDFENRTVMAHFAIPKYDDELLVEKLGESSIGDADNLEVVRAGTQTPATTWEIMPAINVPELRLLGASKWKQYMLAREFMPKTILVEAGQELEESLLENFLGEKLVIKADKSRASNYLKIVPKQEALAAIASMRDRFVAVEKKQGKKRLNDNIIIQEYIPGLLWKGLKGADYKSNYLLTTASDTELRMYCFVDKDKKIDPMHRYYGTARVFDNDRNDEWASIEQDSIPPLAWRIVDIVSDRFLKKADAPVGYLAIDLFLGKAPGDLKPHIFVREVNTRCPSMVDWTDNRHDAFVERRLLANAMIMVAKSHPAMNNDYGI